MSHNQSKSFQAVGTTSRSGFGRFGGFASRLGTGDFQNPLLESSKTTLQHFDFQGKGFLELDAYAL